MAVPLSANGASLVETSGLRAKVDALEASILGLPQIDIQIRHYFAPGLYAREVSIPAGALLIGAIHKTENLICVSKGSLQVVTEDGTTTVTAPAMLTCPAGRKNAVHALEDSVWTNFHPTNETDLDKLAEIFTESKSSELLGGADNKQLIANAALLEN